MAEDIPTILLVHAHPDDEASTTGGTIARYANAGARVVLVTCTNGELGKTPDGLTPEDDDHDTALVAAHRLAELEASVRILGVTRLVLLGYHDSGMAEWDHNDDAHSFFGTSLAETAAKLAIVLEEERPDVVITYDENGFYGHPDHIKANRTTHAALTLTGQNPKLYYATIPRSAFAQLGDVLAKHGVAPPGGPQSEDTPQRSIGVLDEEVAAFIDVAGYTQTKRAALEAHASQTAQSFFVQIPAEAFDEIFAAEYFVRVDSTWDTVETDLLDGTAYAGFLAQAEA